VRLLPIPNRATPIGRRIAWLAQNFQGAENVLVILALVAVVFTTGAIVGVNHAAYRRISELENL
jgi:hypothetical protein